MDYWGLLLGLVVVFEMFLSVGVLVVAHKALVFLTDKVGVRVTQVIVAATVVGIGVARITQKSGIRSSMAISNSSSQWLRR